MTLVNLEKCFSPQRWIQNDWVDKFTWTKADNLPFFLAYSFEQLLHKSLHANMVYLFLSYGRLGVQLENEREKNKDLNAAILCQIGVSQKILVKCCKL